MRLFHFFFLNYKFLLFFWAFGINVQHNFLEVFFWDKVSGTFLLALDELGCSEILLRLWVKFWKVITLEQELWFNHLEEPLSLTITYTENWRNPASWFVTWNKCWIECVNTLQRVCLAWLHYVSCHCCNFWSLVWLGRLQCCTVTELWYALEGLTSAQLWVFPSVPKSHKICVMSESIARQKCCMTEPSNRAALRNALFQSFSHQLKWAAELPWSPLGLS